MPATIGLPTQKKKTDVLDAINGVVGAVQTANTLYSGASNLLKDSTQTAEEKIFSGVAPQVKPDITLPASQLPSDRMLSMAPAILRRAKQNSGRIS